MQAKTTVALFQLEKMVKCNCEQGLEVIYVCLKNEGECPDSKLQKFYCAQCSQDKHDHKPIMIAHELERMHKAWQILKTETNNVFQHVQGIFKELEPLVLYLEEAMMEYPPQNQTPIKWISIDFQKLKCLYEESQTCYNGKIQILYQSANLYELSLLNNQLSTFNSSLLEVQYLIKIGEDMIWKEYQRGITLSGRKKFYNFSNDNIHLFYRFKLRQIEAQLADNRSNHEKSSQYQVETVTSKKDSNTSNEEKKNSSNLILKQKNLEEPQDQTSDSVDINFLSYQVNSHAQKIEYLQNSIQLQAVQIANRDQQLEVMKQEQILLRNQMAQLQASRYSAEENKGINEELIQLRKQIEEQKKIAELKESFQSSILATTDEQRQFVYQVLLERIQSKINMKMLFRATRDGFSNSKFHELCDNKGPLLVLIKTFKGILIGGFCSIDYKSSGDFKSDPKCVVFSITREKVYPRENNDDNIQFANDRGPVIGRGIVINNKLLRGWCNVGPFNIKKNGEGDHALVEQKDQEWKDMQEYEVFACQDKSF